MKPREHNIVLGVCLALAIGTLACYWPITHHGFVSVDDAQYITQNRHVTPGLTWAGAGWALRSGYAFNWHPLTWLSHMMDCEFFGLNSGAHHLTNLLLHIANSLLLFLFLRRLTEALWRSAFVAAFFAWHPLHVESVAWASERKDVLSALFFLLTLWAYAEFARNKEKAEIRGPKSERSPKPETRIPASPGLVRSYYALSLVFFACGLMSKPMLVTTPFVLLLLDYWPLRRFRPGSENQNAKIKNLVVEKLPFFALATAASVVTYLVQDSGGAVAAGDALPLSLRCANALICYWRYLGKTFWPANLAEFYPYPKHVSPVLAVAAALGLAVVSAWAWRQGKRRPHVAVGWFWYLGMLVPTIGLVQVGPQALADRYMYLPSIGLFVLLVWGAADLLAAWNKASSQLRAHPGYAAFSLSFPRRGEARGDDDEGSRAQFPSPQPSPRSGGEREWASAPGGADRPQSGRSDVSPFLATAGGVALACCLVTTSSQLKHWQNGETLFRHALAMTGENGPAWDGLGTALRDMGRKEEARDCFSKSVRLQPQSADAQYNLGTILLELGQTEDALDHLNEVVRSRPRHAPAQLNLGCAYLKLGRLPEARLHFAQAAALEPEDAQAHYNLGTVLLLQTNLEGAQAELSTAVRLAPGYVAQAVQLDPNDALLRYNLGTILLMQSQSSGAVEQLAAAVRLAPEMEEAQRNLAVALMGQGKGAEALPHFAEAARLDPANPDIHFDFGRALLEQDRPAEAVTQLTAGLQLRPGDTNAQSRLAAAQARLRK